jgi:hypothetical protein
MAGLGHRLALAIAYVITLLGRRVILTVLCLAACDSDGKRSASATVDSARAAPLPRRSPPAPGDPSCPSDGRWRRCSLTYALLRAGMGSTWSDSAARVDWLHADSAFRVALGRSELRVFLYKDSAAVVKDLATVDTLSLAPKGAAFPWPSAPTVIRSSNLLAILFDASDEKMERVQLTLTAGAPLPN